MYTCLLYDVGERESESEKEEEGRKEREKEKVERGRMERLGFGFYFLHPVIVNTLLIWMMPLRRPKGKNWMEGEWSVRITRQRMAFPPHFVIHGKSLLL